MIYNYFNVLVCEGSISATGISLVLDVENIQPIDKSTVSQSIIHYLSKYLSIKQKQEK
jgi:hypothetical protein